MRAGCPLAPAHAVTWRTLAAHPGTARSAVGEDGVHRNPASDAVQIPISTVIDHVAAGWRRLHARGPGFLAATVRRGGAARAAGANADAKANKLVRGCASGTACARASGNVSAKSG